jgi:hypothetical protein
MQFPNPIVTELIISYPTGTPAVQIGPGPEVQFFGNGNTLTIEAVSPTGGPLIEFELANGNNADIQGFGSVGGQPALAFLGYNYTASNYGNITGYPYVYMVGNEIAMQFQEDAGTGPTYGAGILLFDTEVQIFTGVQPNLSSEGNKILMQQSHFFSDLPWQTGSWLNVSFAAGWGNAGGDNANFQYRLCSDGFIHWRGTIVPGTTANGTVIGTFTNAAPYLPPQSRFLYRSGADGTTPTNNPQVKFDTSGNITIFGMTGITFLAFDGWMYESAQYMA